MLGHALTGATWHPAQVSRDLPHGIWGSGDGRRVYVGLENGDRRPTPTCPWGVDIYFGQL